MSENNSYFLVYKWMITELKLSPTEVLVFALLYSFCTHNEHCFPSQNYIAECTGLTRRGVNKIISRLCESGLVIKRKPSNKLCSCNYEINSELVKRSESNSNTDRHNIPMGCEPCSHEDENHIPMGYEQYSHNNKEYIKEYNKNYTHYSNTYRYRGRKRDDSEEWGYQY